MKIKELKHASEYAPKILPTDNDIISFNFIVDLIETSYEQGMRECSIKINSSSESFLVEKLLEKGFDTSIRYIDYMDGRNARLKITW